MDKNTSIIFSVLGVVILFILGYLVYDWHKRQLANAAANASNAAAAEASKITAKTGDAALGFFSGIGAGFNASPTLTGSKGNNGASNNIISFISGLGTSFASYAGNGGSESENASSIVSVPAAGFGLTDSTGDTGITSFGGDFGGAFGLTDSTGDTGDSGAFGGAWSSFGGNFGNTDSTGDSGLL